MISVDQLKSKFQGFLRPLVNFLAKIGVTANMVTIFALLLSLVVGIGVPVTIVKLSEVTPDWYLALYALLLLPIVLLIRMKLNVIDNMLVCEHNQKNKLGVILNELGDIFSDLVLYPPLLWIFGIHPVLILVIALLIVISETCGIIGLQIGASRRHDGPMGKNGRAIWFSIMAVVAIIKPGWLPFPDYVSYIIIVLLLITSFKRLRGALKEEVKIP